LSLICKGCGIALSEEIYWVDGVHVMIGVDHWIFVFYVSGLGVLMLLVMLLLIWVMDYCSGF
jgi:hypothetical protein